MANRSWNLDDAMLIKKVRTLYCDVSVGAAGAVTLKKRQYTAMGTGSAAASSSLVNAPTTGNGYAIGNAAGIKSVARTGAGLWTVTLSDAYQYLIAVRIAQTSNTTGLLTALGVGIVSASTNVATNTSVGSGGVIALALNDGAAAAASTASAAIDPANGDTLTLEIILGDATEP